MPTTSNFGWTTPADTDYVKDGANAIRTLANGIDTSLIDLKGGTTGQILSKNSNTDLDYTWINNDQGDITGVTAGTGLSGGGTSGSVTLSIDSTVATLAGTQTLTNKTLTAPKFETAGEIDDANGNELIKFPATVASAVNEITVANAATGSNPSITASGNDANISLNLVAKGSGTVQAGGVPVVTTTGTQTLTNKTLTSPTITNASGVINNTLTTTTGDIIYASAANTPARLGIGSSGQVLTVSGGVPSWAAAAGGATLIVASSFGGGSSLAVTNCFSTTYENYLVLIDVKTDNSSNRPLFWRFTDGSGNDRTQNYHGAIFGYTNSSTTLQQTNSANAAQITFPDVPGANFNNRAYYALNITRRETDNGYYPVLTGTGFTPADQRTVTVGGSYFDTADVYGFRVYNGTYGLFGSCRVYGYKKS